MPRRINTPLTPDVCFWPGCRVCGRDSVAALLQRDGGRDGIHLLQLQLSSGAVGTAAVSYQQNAKQFFILQFAIILHFLFVWLVFFSPAVARCQGCVSSRWGCNWCIHEHVCTHKHACSQGVTIYNQNVSPRGRFVSVACARLKASCLFEV